MQFSARRFSHALLLFRSLVILGAAILAAPGLFAQDQNIGPEKLPSAQDQLRPAPILSPEQLRDTAHPDKDDTDEDLLFPMKRNQWFQHLRAYPNAHIPTGAYWRSEVQREALIARQRAMLAGLKPEVAAQVVPLSTVKWTFDGPEPVAAYGGSIPYSGRATSIAINLLDPTTIYLGTAAGGVWKTINAGQTWLPISDSQASLAIGAIAVDPNNPNNVFAGTGEPDYSGDSYYGQGLLKSTNAGQTWTLIRTPFTTGLTAPDFTSIAVQPGNSEIVLAANQAGLYRSADGGTTWTEVIASGISTVLFDVKNHSIVYAGAGGYGTTMGPLLKSTNAGLTWTAINGTGTSVVQPLANVLRTSIAEDATGTNLFAAFAQSNYSSPGWVYKSVDGGAHWTQLTSPSGLDWYRNAIAVSPNNPLVLYATGAALYQSTDGGKTWAQVGGQAYADQHAFAFTPDGKTMYLADDGGVFVNTSPAAPNATFTSLNATIGSLTFYPNFSILAGKPNSMLGGSQDHGLNLYLGELGWPNGEQSGFCGDGNGVYIDPKGQYAYAHCQGGSANWTVNPTGDNSTASWVAAQYGISTSDRWPWVADIKGDLKNTAIVYTGTNRLYKSIDNAQEWTAISPDLTNGGEITTIAVSPNDSNTIYVGSDDGKVSVTNNATAGASATWKTLSGLPNLSISKIVVQPDSDYDVYATLNGFGFGHVYHSTNGGATWTNISGDLPDTPADSILIDPNIPTTIYLATDTGVYVTTNGGTNWVPLGSGLPNVVVQDILMYQPTRTLRVVTHGRGAWDAVLNQIIPLTVAVSPAPLDSPNTATVTFTLNLPAPTGGATIALTSSNSTVFPVPASLLIAAGSTTGSIKVTTAKITAATSVTVSGSYNGATVKDGVALYPGSFSLTASASTATVVQGKSVALTFKVQSLNNFTGKVVFSAANLPTGYVAAGTTWNPTTVSPAVNGSASSIFTLDTNSLTLPGTYTVNLEASSTGYTTQTVPVTIKVLAAAAPAITSLSPATMAASATIQTLKIAGTNFLSGDTLTFTPPGGVPFPGVAADLAFVSATALTYQFNNGSTPGKWSVVVNSPDGTTHSNAGNFTVTSAANNPVPAVKEFGPATLWIGAPPQRLLIAGTGFLYSSTATFNGVAHTATYLGPTELAIQLSAADLAAVGSYPVVVANPAPGGGHSVAVKFSVTFGPWTWFSGSNSLNLHGVEGAEGFASAANFPGARAGGSSWTDASGNFWLFGGDGYDAGTSFTVMNDLWKFIPATKAWEWVTGGATGVYYGSYGQQGTASTGNTPGSREYSASWSDAQGNFWLFGGASWDAGSGVFGPMNDLWAFNPTAKTWEWVSGSEYSNPSGTYGTKGVAAATTVPGGRDGLASWVDKAGNFWIFGGQGLDASGTSGYLNDLWEFSPSTGKWIWMGGGTSVGAKNSGAKGVYGAKGVAATANVPGGRTFPSSWIDASGNFWLFGGNGFDSAGVFGYLNDLWEFNPTTKVWTWISGSSTITPANAGPKGVYGTQGVAAAANTPGGRDAAQTWTDSAGNHWLYGGFGFDVNGFQGSMGDLWEFNTTTHLWTWMSGSINGNPAAAYGTKGVGSVANLPGGRTSSMGWADKSGELWLFGGTGASGYFSDLWRFQP